MVLALWLGLFAALGAFGLPRAAGLADRVEGRVDIELAGHAVQSAGIPATTAALVAELRRDDPALRLSDTTIAGKPSILPGTAGVAADGQEAVLALRAGNQCFRAIVTAANVEVQTSTGECVA